LAKPQLTEVRPDPAPRTGHVVTLACDIGNRDRFALQLRSLGYTAGHGCDDALATS
jgi:hypothetical protein